LNIFAAILYSSIKYHHLIAIIFLAAFVAQTFSNAFIIVDYYTNTKKYVANCENKATPMMHCNGKCQMLKKLQEEQKKDQENPERRSENKNEITLSSKSFAPMLPAVCCLEVKSKNNFHDSNAKPVDHSFDIFHPPQA